jgi:capsular polysaccharide biosynthesis protein/Mrp family chromosome partitioning ATPase
MNPDNEQALPPEPPDRHGVPAMASDATDEHGLRAYLEILQRRKRLILIVTFALPAVAFLFTLQQQERFRATAAVLLSQQDSAAVLAGIANPIAQEDPDRFAVTQSRLARTPDVLQATVKRSGLRRDVGDFRRHSSVSATADADVLYFTVTDQSRSGATRLAGDYAQEFSDYRRQLDARVLTQARLGVEAKLAQLAAKGDTSSTQYKQFRASRQRLATLGVMQSPRAIVTGIPRNATKVQPRPLRTTTSALAIGLLLGIGLAFLLEALDTRVRSASDLAARLDLRLLGSLPTLPAGAMLEMVHADERAGPLAETLRRLELTFDFANTEVNARVIMVASGHDSLERACVSLDLAGGCARDGRTVLLIDANVGNPQINALLGIDESPGFCDLDPEASLPESDSRRKAKHMVRETYRPPFGLFTTTVGRGTLAVLPAGSVNPFASPLRDPRALVGLFERLATPYDIVLVNGPALLAGSEGLAVAGAVDAIVVVSGLEGVDRSKARELRRVVDSIPATKLGLVVADTAGRKADRRRAPWPDTGRAIAGEPASPVTMRARADRQARAENTEA